MLEEQLHRHFHHLIEVRAATLGALAFRVVWVY
jgi:hypothetical protein